LLKDRLERLEEQIIRHRWHAIKGNKTRVADELGLTRVGLRMKLTRLGLEGA
jgi:two-component system response regulator HupR/HoxA